LPRQHRHHLDPPQLLLEPQRVPLVLPQVLPQVDYLPLTDL
jgi:hypothetical protein